MQMLFFTVIVSVALLGSIVVPALGATRSKLIPAQLTVEPLPECKNLLQCNASFHAGETITFTGILTDEKGKFIPDATVNIYRSSALETQLLASGVTELDGSFEIKWKAQFIEKKEAGETFKQQLREVSMIFAEFPGNDQYAQAKSGKMVITVKIMDVLNNLATDKRLYREGENALIIINFIEGEIAGKNIMYRDFIDPDRVAVTYDGATVELTKKKVGTYAFVTPPLTIGHHQLTVNPAKDGYNTSVGFITVQVSGFFGK
jgi:hypothetical protein